MMGTRSGDVDFGAMAWIAGKPGRPSATGAGSQHRLRPAGDLRSSPTCGCWSRRGMRAMPAPAGD